MYDYIGNLDNDGLEAQGICSCDFEE